MNFDFMFLTPLALNKVSITEVLRCNETTSRFGLALSPAEAAELVETRTAALNRTGRIEFAGGIIRKLIVRFCDSPYLDSHNYAETLNDLMETFYYFKNETMDEVSDDELITWMKQCFDQSCQGSLELLQSRDLENLARRIRFGMC
ncbi:MAG TPA: DUF6323 family protein, partial [Bacillota bacterium]|nr:DUF6323 family protein [Bacillota bacterium]